jgi:hypothetical protein
MGKKRNHQVVIRGAPVAVFTGRKNVTFWAFLLTKQRLWRAVLQGSCHTLPATEDARTAYTDQFSLSSLGFSHKISPSKMRKAFCQKFNSSMAPLIPLILFHMRLRGTRGWRLYADNRRKFAS